MARTNTARLPRYRARKTPPRHPDPAVQAEIVYLHQQGYRVMVVKESKRQPLADDSETKQVKR